MQDTNVLEKLKLNYAEGLVWVMKYYYQGCASWRWYYPHYYAPFTAEVYDVSDVEITYEKTTKPFKPIEQLMGVLPPARYL
jgi:5'-3' exoribonuclease 2